MSDSPDEQGMLPEQEPPAQPEATGDRKAKVRLTCRPSLDQATIVAREQHAVAFNVLLEGASLSTRKQPQVCIWHNHNGEHDWEELHMQQSSGSDEVSMFKSDSSLEAELSTRRSWCTASLAGSPKHGQEVQFTLKYRLSDSDPWQWIKDTDDCNDGQLLYQARSSVDTAKHTSYSLSDFLPDISPDIHVSTEQSETSDTLLYSLTCPVSPAEGLEPGYAHHRLGKVKDAARWFALVRLWSPWLAPRHGNGDVFKVDKDAVLVSFLRTDGMHVVCLALSGIEDVLTTFIDGKGGNVEIKGKNDSESEGTSRVLVAVAAKFEVANAAVMYHARKVVAELSCSSDVQDQIEASTVSDDPKAEWLEEWYDGLSYCTWNGLGQGLTVQKIMDALADLHKNEINITNLIIDDNWQTLSTGSSQFVRGWSDFEANPSGFPDGLSHLTRSIREKYANIQHIAVWHAILGYWGGIDPDGKIASRYKTIEVEKEEGLVGGKFTVVAAEDAKRFYNDFYTFLKNSGIDGVKTDAQFFLDLLAHAPDRKSLIKEYQDAWTINHLRHFSSRAISCMSQFPQAIFHSQLPQNRPTLLLRNSDDFFPDVEASHAWHIFCNAHNTLLNQHLNALPDWDMFQTSHDWAAFHAAARCVSGGPVYITDKPGEHDLELIGQMCAQTTQGRTVILRPHRIGKSMGVYLPYESAHLLKVGTYAGHSGTGSGILGIFNVWKANLREFVGLEEFPGTEEGDYVVGSFRLGEVSKPMRRGGNDAFVGVEMGVRGWDILTAYAARDFTLHRGSPRPRDVKVAVMGLLGKMTGAAGTTSVEIDVESNGRLRMKISLKALGVLGLWISDLDEMTVEENVMVTMYGKPVPAHCVRKSEDISAEGAGGVLEIDIGRAWKENKEEAGYNNQAEVEIYVS